MATQPSQSPSGNQEGNVHDRSILDALADNTVTVSKHGGCMERRYAAYQECLGMGEYKDRKRKL